MCDSLGNIEGKIVILSSRYYGGNDEERKFLCNSGFGCHDFTLGTAVFGQFVSDGQFARVERYEIERVYEQA